MSKNKKALATRTRILLWTLFFSIMPLLAMYFLLGQVLDSTNILIVKDAADYTERKTLLLKSTLRNDLESALEYSSNLAAINFRHFLEKQKEDPESALKNMLGEVAATNIITLVFDAKGKLIHEQEVDSTYKGKSLREVLDHLSGRNHISVATTLEPTDWKLVLSSPLGQAIPWEQAAIKFRDDFTQGVRAKVNQTTSWLDIFATVLLLGMGLVALVLSRWLTQTLSRPIERLVEAVEKFDGSKKVEITAERMDEIGLLTNKFSEMTEKLVTTRRELSQKQQALEKADYELMQVNLTLEQRIREQTKDLENSLNQLRELDKNKDEFLGLVSHELKTPLTSISASAEALLADDLPLGEDQSRRFIRIIQDEANRLGRLINNLLDMTRLEAGRLPFHYAVVDLGDVTKTICETHLAAIERKGLHLDLEIADDVRMQHAVIDCDRYVQILTNLISNAIKFTNRGRISVNVAILQIGQRPMIRLVAADTGIGIEPEDAPKVFDRFQQIEGLDTHHEGWGLGMPISKMLVTSMGGEIHFASKPKHGTAFTVTLPYYESLEELEAHHREDEELSN